MTTDNDQAAVDPDGWHDFTTEQAQEFLADMKRQHPGRWTGLGRIAETMTAAVVAEKARADEAEREQDAARSAWSRALGERDRLAGLLIDAVAVIKATRDENPGQRWSHTLEVRMLAAFDSVTHAQLWARKGTT